MDTDLSPAERIIAGLNEFDGLGRSLTPQGISEAVAAGHCIDVRARIGGKVEIRSRGQGGIDFAPWTWFHRSCARYRPEGVPADFYGGAPGWAEAWAYVRRHMRNFHGVELGEAGWHVG